MVIIKIVSQSIPFLILRYYGYIPNFSMNPNRKFPKV